VPRTFSSDRPCPNERPAQASTHSPFRVTRAQNARVRLDGSDHPVDFRVDFVLEPSHLVVVTVVHVHPAYRSRDVRTYARTKRVSVYGFGRNDTVKCVKYSPPSASENVPPSRSASTIFWQSVRTISTYACTSSHMDGSNSQSLPGRLISDNNAVNELTLRRMPSISSFREGDTFSAIFVDIRVERYL